MKSRLTIQERLKDLRKEKDINLEKLEELTGISKSALGSYEANDYKEINLPYSFHNRGNFRISGLIPTLWIYGTGYKNVL